MRLCMSLCLIVLSSAVWAEVVPFKESYSAESTTDGWTSSVQGDNPRFTPMIYNEADLQQGASDNYFLSVNQSERNNNGCVVTGTVLSGKASAGNDFTLEFDMKLCNSGNNTSSQSPVSLQIKDADNNQDIFSLSAQKKYVTTWNVNGTDLQVTLPDYGGQHISYLTWCHYKISRSGKLTYLTITNNSTQEPILERTLIEGSSEMGGLGNIVFTTKRLNANFAIDNIEVRVLREDDVPSNETTSYTIRYRSEDGEVLNSDIVTPFAVGGEATASSAQMAPIYFNDKKFIYKEGNSTITLVGEAAQNVITLIYREAQQCKYMVKARYGTNEKVLLEGTGLEQDVVTYHYPEYMLDGTTLYLKKMKTTDPRFGSTIFLSDANITEYVDYEDGETSGVVYYKEAEQMEGFTSLATNNADIRCSDGKGGVIDGDAPVVLTTLPAGSYSIFGQVWGTAGYTATIMAGDRTVWELSSVGWIIDATSDILTLDEETTLYIKDSGDLNGKRMLDLIYIQEAKPHYIAKLNRVEETLTFKQGALSLGAATTWDAENTGSQPGWYSQRSNVKTVIFDKSFADAHPASCSFWFGGASSFTSITGLEYLNTSETVSMNLMFYQCSSLTSLDVSNFNTSKVTDMSGMFHGCKSLKTIFAGEGWSTDAVTLGSEMFADCAALVGGNGTMYNDAHTNYEYARIDLPGQPGYFTEKIITGFALNATVTDGDGNDITQDVNIVWYDGDGKQIGTGSILNGVTEDAEVYYSILLPESLGRVYREVNMRKANADEDGAVKCQLEKIGRVTLEGRVSATDIDKTTLTVSVRQMLNGKWAQDYSAQTDRQGLFSIEVYDDATDITISGDGYLDATLHRDGFGGSGNVGTIPVNLLTGFAIAANVSMEKAVATGEASEVTAWTDGLTNIDFVLTNLTKGTTLTDIAVQGGNVVIKSGAAAGDEISLKAVSKQGVFADAETTFTLAEGANSFELQLTELGGVDATYTASNNGTTVGYLYDHNDLLAARGSYKGETLSLRHLKSGTYTLVSMGQSLLLGSMTSLDDLNAVGLREGTDYVTTRIDIADGELAAVSVSDVPHLDETPFYYTTGNTYFNASKASVTAGNYITLQTHIDLKPEHAEKAGGVTLTVDLPEGCTMVENSAIANRQAVPHTVSGNRVTITLAKEQYESEVRFSVIPTLNQSYNVTAMATFDIDGQVQQPIGTAQFEAKGLSLSVPDLTHSATVTVNGTAKGHSEVRIYDNDVLVGTTTSKADGTWTAECELYKPYSHSFHDIYAKITTEVGMELTSETKQVEYDKTNIVPTTVTMLYYNPEYVGQYNIVFDLIKGTTTPSSYYYFPYKNWPNWYETRETEPKDFTFLADFTCNDSTVVKNVNIKVLNSDGTVRSLPATFDGKQGKWVATTKYTSSNRLPQNVQVEYDVIPTVVSDEEREESILDQGAILAACANHIYEELQEKASFTPVADDEQSVTFEMTMDGIDEPFVYRIDNIDFAEAESMMQEHQFTYAPDEEGGTGTYFEQLDNGISVVAVDLSNSYAFRITLTPTNQNLSQRVRRAIDIRQSVNALITSFSNGTFIDGLGNVAGEIGTILGVTQYLSVRSDFDNMCNQILNYNDVYAKLRKNALDALLAKCPDGSYRISQEKIVQWSNVLNAESDSESAFTEQYCIYLQEYQNKLKASVGTFIASMGLGKAFGALGKSAKFIDSKANQWLLKHLSANATAEISASILSNLLGTATDQIISGIDKIFDFTNFDKVRDTALEFASENHSVFLKNYADIKKGILDSYKKCEKKEDKDEKNNDEPTDDNSDFNGNGTRPIIDPSGYVYEAVLSNRLEGVATTCYEQVNGSAVLWNAEDYSQQNPLKTDATGFYRWDVPQGMWQVKYEKEGYETAYSEWLPVPPPQLDVNIGMKQSTPPTVKEMRGYEEGITIEMGKYMRPETMTAERITVTRNGSPESGSIVALNTEQEPLGEATYVSKVRFVPETAFNSSDVVVVTVHKEVESYCGVQMKADHVETVKIEAEVKSIVADETISVPYQGERELRVVVLPKDAAVGKTLRIRNSSQMIAAVDASEVVIGQDGAATLTVGGSLPGGAVLDFAIDGSDVTWTTKVQVMMGRDMVAMPTTNIASGETVGDGTMLALSCTTPGATIYYTLDGSCPCDEATRIKYEAPIAITESVVVKAIAVKEGMDDSDVATFIYMLTGIRSSKLDGQIQMECHDGTLTITGAKGANCQIYDLGGRELTSRSNMDSEATFHLKTADACLVHIRQKDGQSAVYKIQVR